MLPKNFKPEQGSSRYILNNLNSGGKIKFRLVSNFIVGKSVWGDVDGKRVPTRRKEGESIPVANIGINRFTGKAENIKQFIAGVVWNYESEQLEILETDKSTIIGQIFEIEANEDWKDSKSYDLTISKKGEGMDTSYSVLPSNKADFKCPNDPKTVSLDALFEGSDPFSEGKATSEDEDIITEKVDTESEIPF